MIDDDGTPRIVAVVVTFNRLALLQRLVARLREVPEVSEILVVDNASADGTGEWLVATAATDGPELVVRTLDRNRGGAGGFHEGLQLAVESSRFHLIATLGQSRTACRVSKEQLMNSNC